MSSLQSARRRAPVARARPGRAGLLIALLLAAWLVVGGIGVWRYVADYYAYRGFGKPRDPVGVARGRLITFSFFSRALGRQREYGVYLPPGYDRLAAAGTRFPVLYLLHGSPGRPGLYLNAGAVGVRMDELVHAGRVRPFLLVIPDGRNGGSQSDTEWADTPAGRFESAVLDVVGDVDARLPTLARRDQRGIAGYSEGAYASVNIALRHLAEFAVVQSWSGYYNQVPSGPFAGVPWSLLRANSPAMYVGSLRPRLSRLPLNAYLYIGGRDPGAVRAERFADQLRAAGASVTFAIYPGGHSWQLWRARVPTMLTWASDRFAHPGRARSSVEYVPPQALLAAQRRAQAQRVRESCRRQRRGLPPRRHEPPCPQARTPRRGP